MTTSKFPQSPIQQAASEALNPIQQAVSEAMVSVFNGVTPGTLQGFTPDGYETLYALGHRLYQQDEYLEALQVFGFLLSRNFLDRRFVMAFGATLQMLDRYEEALKYYVVCATLDLNDPAPAFHLAECLLQMGRTSEAREGFQAILMDGAKTGKRHAFFDRAQAMFDLLSRESSQKEAV
ncbi:SycD/LcrH family type III secretion system chaperone [Paraburkholderia bonniea]|uniref:SycD/LcrH family type III secretion system chaperone n=1 Tax=Paraburkholderia bonniea TaxID=2152891 RepID=UPI001580C571|nr:SycD/LcrH family type III secretion system chaperone [Paraburkholderia bonniea]WJF89289.1 SycD/LcrH family type III secretion system chaperone [Paraburkholderia bonniea]WJF92605.1 SycD/LcrH family type III secretion system chaperone [Paraburkholderia bonniea]